MADSDPSPRSRHESSGPVEEGIDGKTWLIGLAVLALLVVLFIWTPPGLARFVGAILRLFSVFK